MSAAQPSRHSNGLAWQARAYKLWEAGTDASHGVRMIGRRTLVPVMRNGVMRNLQIIEQDGATRFLTPGKTRGCCHLIGRPAGLILAAAEFSTSVQLFDATGQAVAVCFDPGNIPHVIRKLWCEYSVPVVAVTPEFDPRIESVAAAVGGLSVGIDFKPWGSV